MDNNYGAQQDDDDSIADMKEYYESSPLPDGWKQVSRASGTILYVNEANNVVTLSRPYSYEDEQCLDEIADNIPQTGVEKTRVADDDETSSVADDEIKTVVRQNDKIVEVEFNYGKNRISNRADRKRLVLSYEVNDKTIGRNAVLHDYCQTVLRCSAAFKTTAEVVRDQNFITTTCVVGGKSYGSATSRVKKESANLAALRTIKMLLPGFKEARQNALASQSARKRKADTPPDGERYYPVAGVERMSKKRSRTERK